MEHRLFWGEHPPNHRESIVNHTSTPICPYVWNICSVDEYINHYKSSKSWCHPPNSDKPCQIRGLEDYFPLKPSDSHGQTNCYFIFPYHISHPILSPHIPFSPTLSKLWNTTKIIYKSSINHLQIIYKSSTNHLQINYKSSTNHLQIIYKSSTNHLQIIYKSSTNHLQIIYKSSTNHLQIIYKSSTNHLQIIYKSSTNHL